MDQRANPLAGDGSAAAADAQRPLILLTNDDGVHAAGLAAMEAALRHEWDVVVVAPHHEKSGVAHALTMHRPLRVQPVGRGRFAVDGTPVDCVTLGLSELALPRRPGLVVAGINHGSNIADDVLYSGTVAAALEALIYGLPGIAVSSAAVAENDQAARFAETAAFAAGIVRLVLDRALAAPVALNINAPALPARGWTLTRQAARVITTDVQRHLDPRGQPCYWIGRERSRWLPDPESDRAALDNGFISVMPMTHDLTHPDRSHAFSALIEGTPWPPALRATPFAHQKDATADDAARRRR